MIRMKIIAIFLVCTLCVSCSSKLGYLNSDYNDIELINENVLVIPPHLDSVYLQIQDDYAYEFENCVENDFHRCYTELFYSEIIKQLSKTMDSLEIIEVPLRSFRLDTISAFDISVITKNSALGDRFPLKKSVRFPKRKIFNEKKGMVRYGLYISDLSINVSTIIVSKPVFKTSYGPYGVGSGSNVEMYIPYTGLKIHYDLWLYDYEKDALVSYGDMSVSEPLNYGKLSKSDWRSLFRKSIRSFLKELGVRDKSNMYPSYEY